MDGIPVSNLIGGCFALYFTATLASSGGLGGGGLIVPILLVIFELEYKKAGLILYAQEKILCRLTFF